VWQKSLEIAIGGLGCRFCMLATTKPMMSYTASAGNTGELCQQFNNRGAEMLRPGLHHLLLVSTEILPSSLLTSLADEQRGFKSCSRWEKKKKAFLILLLCPQQGSKRIQRSHASDLTLPTMIKRRNGLNFLHLFLYFVPALHPWHLLFNIKLLTLVMS